MRVALAQINLTIGDFAGNLQKIRDSLARAREQRADLLVLPELGISGYPPGDLLERPSFLRDQTRALEELVSESREIAILTGAILPAPDGGPKRISNSAVLLDRGEIAHVQAKTLLPTYDIFDESRYFQPAAERRVFRTPDGREVPWVLRLPDASATGPRPLVIAPRRRRRRVDITLESDGRTGLGTFTVVVDPASLGIPTYSGSVEFDRITGD